MAAKIDNGVLKLYCYACRGHKVTTHGHFHERGILVLRPPKREISETDAIWERMSEEEQSRALEEGRQLLAQAEADAQAGTIPPSRGASKAGNVGKAGKASAQGREGNGSIWGLAGVGVVVVGFFGWLFWQGRGA